MWRWGDGEMETRRHWDIGTLGCGRIHCLSSLVPLSEFLDEGCDSDSTSFSLPTHTVRGPHTNAHKRTQTNTCRAVTCAFVCWPAEQILKSSRDPSPPWLASIVNDSGPFLRMRMGRMGRTRKKSNER
jgi:hypothetical protein